jgi:aspartate ammonia-lyase
VLWAASVLARVPDNVYYGVQTQRAVECEATLYGVREPEKIRALILSQRQSVYKEKAGDA